MNHSEDLEIPFEQRHSSVVPNRRRDVTTRLRDLEAEITRLFDGGLDTPGKILEALGSAWLIEGKARFSELLDDPCDLVNEKDIQIIVRRYQEYRWRFPKAAGPGRPRKLSWQGYRFLARLLYHNPPPAVCGYKEKGWTKRLLVDCLTRWGEYISETTLTRVLHDADYAWDGQYWWWWQPPAVAQTPSAEQGERNALNDACGCFEAAIFHEDLERINAMLPHPSLAVETERWQAGNGDSH
jgi:hypothetical protein